MQLYMLLRVRPRPGGSLGGTGCHRPARRPRAPAGRMPLPRPGHVRLATHASLSRTGQHPPPHVMEGWAAHAGRAGAQRPAKAARTARGSRPCGVPSWSRVCRRPHFGSPKPGDSHPLSSIQVKMENIRRKMDQAQYLPLQRPRRHSTGRRRTIGADYSHSSVRTLRKRTGLTLPPFLHLACGRGLAGCLAGVIRW